MCKYEITAEQLDALRNTVADNISAVRFEHTLGVERAAAGISRVLCPEKLTLLCGAALLHDITKEYSFEKQLKICNEFGIILRNDEKNSPQILHAITAAAVIPSEYPDFACPELISAVRWHTTGRADMTLADKIIFLADYIEDGRRYESCRDLRESFWCGLTSARDDKSRLNCLDTAVLAELKGTIRSLGERGLAVNADTLRAADYITNQLKS